MAYYMLVMALAVEGNCSEQIAQEAASGHLAHACKFATEFLNDERPAIVNKLSAKALPALFSLSRRPALDTPLKLPMPVRAQRPPVPD